VTDHKRMIRLRSIFLSALDVPDADRDAFLERECSDDANLLAEARSLLDKSHSLAGFLKTGIGEELLRNWPGELDVNDASASQEVVGDKREAPLLPDEIGGFVVKRLLGEGGMGVVYEAEQKNPRRRVALKVIRAAARADDRHIKLFERESRALAQLEHPGIAAIHEAGGTADGRHFFAMELVRGMPLHEYFSDAPSGDEIKARLDLFKQICVAVDYAHKHGVIHRDLNPTNIFVIPAEKETEGSALNRGAQIKILDFGLAKVTESDVTLTTLTKEVGRIQGTLAYMSPEQARGDSSRIDHRSDIYSLGVILYEMLTGMRPYDVRQALIHQALRVICEDDPIRPSVLLPRLRGDLETILLKALEKSPNRRYQSVSEFLGDIERFLANKPILARPPTATYQLKKLIVRHKVPFAVAAGLFVLLIAFGSTMSILYRSSVRQRERAEIEAQKAEKINEFLQGMLASPDPRAEGRDVTVRAVLDSAAVTAYEDLAAYPEVQGAVLETLGDTYLALGLVDDSERHLRAALDIRRKALGEHHPDVGSSLHALGAVLGNRGKLAEAESTLTAALQLGADLYGEDAEQVDAIRNTLSATLQYQGKWGEAEEILRQLVETRRRLPGDNRRDIAEALNGWGWCLWMQDRLAEAEPLYREALSIYTELYGDEHPDVATITDNLAVLLQAQGKAREAEPLHRRALEARRKILGDEHPSIGVSLANLGSSLELQGRYEEAESCYRSSLDNLLAVHGKDHFFTANAMYNLAVILHLQGDYVQAESQYRETLDVRGRIQSEMHPDYNWTKVNLATLLIDTGRFKEAETLLSEARNALCERFPEEHWSRQDVMCRIGLCLAAEGRRAEADSLLCETRYGVCNIVTARRKLDILRRCTAVYEGWGESEAAAVYRNELARLQEGL
jgi:serine/threonine protein kinase/Flp pilus assembly protein TadD